MSIATDTLPNVESVSDLIKEYYRTQVKSEIDLERVNKVVNFNLASYNLPYISTRAPKGFSTRKDEIKYLLSGNNFVNENKMCAYHHEYIREGLQHLLVKHDELLKEGFETVSPQEHNLFHQLSVNKLIMKKPDSLIEEDIKTIKAQVESLIEELNDIERKEKMDVVKAQEWAKAKHAEQQTAYDKAVAELAASEANSLNDMHVNFSQYFDSISSSDYWFFEDVQAICGDAANKDIEEVLNYLGFHSIRKHLADKKQHMIWVKQDKESDIDFKSIEYNK
ncbi:TPA: hypothetical protein NKB00_000656 [Vibrio parahaemolyticus]|nr:hypothetical protein [Vibrio parahaemolyticus]